ncbi:MAG: hypothetical protein GX063_05775 [Firmicutes bacterium]|nr:hypothetical protein [Bacillota bacterium]
MEKLRQSFLKARRWVKRNARPLEAARWEYTFENGTKERVLEILAAYQNEDGGFGHGIEPDFWLSASSPMASWAAARILLEVKAGPDLPMVQALADYLCRTQQPTGTWPAVLPDNNAFPHAPWWHWKPGVESGGCSIPVWNLRLISSIGQDQEAVPLNTAGRRWALH